MNIKNILLFPLIITCLCILLIGSCKKEYDSSPHNNDSIPADTIPTKTLMEGVWVVKEAYDSAGISIIDLFQNTLTPVTAFNLLSDNVTISTAGPMTTYIVYGEEKWPLVSSTIDRVFDYSNLSYNGGEFYVADSIASRFDIVIKLEGVGGTETMSYVMNLFGIATEWIKEVVYHRFNNVKIDFSQTHDTMIWEFDNLTLAYYRMKDQYGEYVFWNGWPASELTKCKLVLERQDSTLNYVVNEAYSSK